MTEYDFRRVRFLLPALLLFVAPVVVGAQDLASQLQDVSVTIKAGDAQGSGVLIARGENTFCLTAGHVVDHLRQTRDVVKDGVKRTQVTFRDAEVIQEFRHLGRRVGDQRVDAAVILYSDADSGHDLAVLLLRKPNFSPACAEFADDAVPAPGTEIFLVGSPRGLFGANTVTDGLISQVGRVLDLDQQIEFDQTSAPAVGGNSGCGAFRKSDGKCVGILVRGGGENFNYIVPARRVWRFVRDNNIEWLLDPSIPVPSVEDLRKLPIEDVSPASTPVFRESPTPATP